MFRLPWNKKTRRKGVSKSPEAREKEQKAKVSLYLNKTWLKYLKEHPAFAQQIAREQFGFQEMEYPEGAPDNFLEKVKEVKSAMDLIKDTFSEGEDKGGGLIGILKEVVAKDEEGALAKSLAGFIARLTQGGVPQLREGEVVAEPKPRQLKKLEDKSSVDEQQKGLTALIERLLSMEPADVAQELYQNRGQPGNVLSIAYQTIVENDFDSLVGMLSTVTSIPEYEFLQPIVDKLDQKWLALVFDEVNTLNTSETKAKPGKTKGKSGETESIVGET